MMARLMAWELNLSWWTDLTLGGIVERVGFDKARDIFPTYPNDVAPIVPSGEWRKTMGSHFRFLKLPKSTVAFVASAACWAAATRGSLLRQKSATAAPILANDIHLQLTNPSKFYEVNLYAPEYDNVMGGSVPGHSRHCAGA